MTPDPSYRTLNIDVHGGVVDLELNRPAKLNAISADMADELADVARRIAGSEDAKVLLLRGAGRAFSAGADVGDATATTGKATSVSAQLARHARMQEALELVGALPVVKIAQIHGHCVGAGLVLATMCELRIASTDARFSVPELAFGLPFSMGGLPRLARYIGLTRAADLVLTGRQLTATDAQHAGLITELVEPGELADTAVAVAKAMAAHPRYLITETVARLRETGVALLEGNRSDLSALVLATLDEESRAVMEEYAREVVAPKT